MPSSQFMNMPLVGLAVVNALAGSVGIVLTIPFTAFLAPYVFKNKCILNEKNTCVAYGDRQ